MIKVLIMNEDKKLEDYLPTSYEADLVVTTPLSDGARVATVKNQDGTFGSNVLVGTMVQVNDLSQIDIDPAHLTAVAARPPYTPPPPPPPPPAPVAPTASLTITPMTITLGQSVTLTWTTSNAAAVSIDQGIGTVAASGSRVISPAKDTVYKLTATSSGGSATSSVMVNVEPKRGRK